MATARRPDLLSAIAREMGADEAIDTTSGAVPKVDVVIDCTGSPEGLETAIEAAKSEVHLKSTHGRPAAGLRHLTELLVVDELSIARFDLEHLPPALSGDRPLIAWLAGGQPPADLAARADVRFAYSAGAVLDRLEAHPPPGSLPRVDAAVVKSMRGVDLAIRPSENREVSVVRPRGAILLDKGSDEEFAASPLLRAVWERGLRLTSFALRRLFRRHRFALRRRERLRRAPAADYAPFPRRRDRQSLRSGGRPCEHQGCGGARGRAMKFSELLREAIRNGGSGDQVRGCDRDRGHHLDSRLGRSAVQRAG
ncbi:MAG: hypothetical protein R2748_30565 [Bryobacterales bacterium]